MIVEKFLWGTFSAFLLITVWYVAALVMNSHYILPTPLSVFLDCVDLLKNPAFFPLLAATCYRGIIAFSISLALSLVFGLAAGMLPFFSAALRPWMAVIKATPVVAFILIALLWFGSSTVPIFVSVLMTIPIMTETIAQGVRSSDEKLLEMAQIYHIAKRDVFLHIQIPSALPSFLSGAGVSLGLTWKVVVAGEILSSPKLGIGSAMQTAKIHLETPRVFSLTLAAIMLSIATELVFNGLIYLSRRYTAENGAA